MKKFLALLLSGLLCFSLCACDKGNDTPNTTNPVQEINKIGDTIGTDAVEVKLKEVSYKDEYVTDEYITVTPKSGYSFVVVNFSLKNVGKTDLTYFHIPNGSTYIPGKIVSVDYNDGYTFMLDDVTVESGVVYSETNFYTNYPTLDKLKPLGEGATYEVAICVPDEVIENTEAPLLIKFFLVNSNRASEVVTYTIR